MKCDFCREEFLDKPYVINREFATLTGNKIRTIEAFNFCSRICMIAEKITAVILIKIRTLQEFPANNQFNIEVKKEVMRISGCTAEEYEKALEKYNSVEFTVCTELDIEKYLQTSVSIIIFRGVAGRVSWICTSLNNCM